MAWAPYQPGEWKQEKEGVITELPNNKQLPEAFFTTVQACNQRGQLLVDSAGSPILERVAFARGGQFWQQVAMTNQTDHVIRFSNVAIRLADPAGNQLEPLTKEDLVARLLSERPCSSSQQASFRFRGIKIFDRNIEVVPGTTGTFWMAFNPPATTMPGVWKVAIYEVPVKVNDAGLTLKAARFEMRMVAKKFIDTYRRENSFAQPILTGTVELD